MRPLQAEPTDLTSSLLDALAALVVVLDPGGRIVGFNAACEQATGYSIDEIRGRTLWDLLIPAEEIAPVRRIFDQLSVGGLPNRNENDWITRSGERRRIAWSNTTVTGAEGMVQYVIGTGIDVTDLRRVQDDLAIASAKEEAALSRAESESWFHALLDAAPDGVLVVDGDGRIAHVNPRLGDWFGYAVEELLGRRVEVLLPAGLRSTHVAHRRAYWRNPAARPMGAGLPLVGAKKDGTEFPIEISLSPVETAEGRHVIAIVRDVTERRRTETALRESERKSRAIFDQTFEFIGLLSPEGILLEVNRTALDFIGARAEDVVGLPFAETPWWRSDVDRDRLLDAQRRAAGGELVRFEVDHATPEGSVARFDFSLKPVRDESGQVVFLIPEGRDITDRKVAERALARNEAAIRSMYEIAAGTGSFTERMNAMLVMGTEHFELPIGVLSRVDDDRCILEAVHAPPGTLAAGEVFDLDDTCCAETIEAAHPVFFQRAAESSHGSRPCCGRLRLEAYIGAPILVAGSTFGTLSFSSPEPRGAPFTPAEREILQLMALWIGTELERLRTHEELGRLAAELKRSNDELEQFAFVASHDLQEPLRTVNGFVKLLKRRYGSRLDPEADEFIDFAVDGTVRMQRLIDDLLAYSRVTRATREMEWVETETVVDEVVQNLRGIIAEHGATVTRGTLPRVWGDRARLQQVFQNLIGNALKFRGAEAPKVHVSAEIEAAARFCVRDNGIGFDPEDAESIFQIFTRLHDRGDYPGTGIGLAICKRIVEQHGGQMSVETSPGAGSAFYFTVPSAPA